MMPSCRWIVACGALLCLAACGQGFEPPDAERATNAIVNGTPSTEPWSVGLSHRDGAVFCSGSLVSPWHVVTAAHCLDPFLGVKVPELVFVCDDARGATPASRPGCYLPVASGVANPAYDLVTGSADIAVLTLGVPRPGPYLGLPSGRLTASAVGAQVRVIGFGADQATVFPDGGVEADGGGLRREGYESAQFVGPMPFGSTLPNVLGLAADTLQTNRSPSAVCFGDSGGSVLLPPSGPQATLVGLPSVGPRGCAGYAVHLMVGAHLCWLAQQGVPTACSDGGVPRWDAGVPDTGSEPADAGGEVPDAGDFEPGAGPPVEPPRDAGATGAPAPPTKESTVVDLGTTKLRPGCGCSAADASGGLLLAWLLGRRRAWARRSLLAVLLGAGGCGPASPLASVSDAELCGGARDALEVSPAAVASWRRDGHLPLTRVRARGERLPGAWADFLENVGATESTDAETEIRFEGPEALAAAVQRCGVRLPEGPEAHLLLVREREVIAAGGPSGQARALATLAQLAGPSGAPRVTVLDAPALPRRFVLEGFYGPEWSWEGRRAVVRLAAAEKLNAYVFAPKSDIYSHFGWATPYPAPARLALKQLTAYARERGVELCWELAPGYTITYSSAEAREAVARRLTEVFELGVRCFALAFDDLPKTLTGDDATRFGSAAAAEVDLALFAKVTLESLGGASLLFVPTDYSTAQMDVDPTYTREIARLPQSIGIGWTGRDIVSAAVSAADVADAAARFGRAPALGDNYPVTDASPTSGRLQLRSIVGREPAAIAALAAYGANGMSLPRLSMVPIASVAELAWAPGSYSPQRAFQFGARRVLGPSSVSALEFVAEHTPLLGEADEAPELRALTRAFLEGGPPHPLRLHFQRMQAVGGELSLAPPEALGELMPWVTKLGHWGALGERLVTLSSGGGAASAEELEAAHHELAALLLEPAQIADLPMKDFAAAMLQRLEPR